VTTSANVELVCSIFADWERGDFSRSAEWAHPEIEYVIADGPDPGSWKGVRPMTEAWREFASAWKDFRVQSDELREIDGERVLVLTRRGGRGKRSELDLGQMRSEGALLFHVRDGKVTRLVAYRDRDRALADLRLAPEADSSTR
jgi:ketosteroid isomerase-like protein